MLFSLTPETAVQLLLILTGGCVILLAGMLVKLCMPPKTDSLRHDLERLERLSREDARDLRQELGRSLLSFNDSIRKTVEERLDKMQSDNAAKLEMMRATVDEKLHATLEKRLGESFALVSQRLEKVHQGLGEMQTLASDVGGLKRVLSNVKTRGTWGEMQLGTLLEQMLSPEQFIKNAHVRPHSAEVVEFAVKLPDGDVLIPIDSKFPIEDYDRLCQAADRGEAALIDAAAGDLEKRIRSEAKRIADKYINPPMTTDFAILFLPTEGLYAEIMRRPGLAAEIQNKHRVSITGPSTLGAFLNSLQMGFRTLAIQKRSGEVWQVLNQAKTEFEKYALWVDKVKRNIELAHKTLDEAETRTRAVNRRLRAVETNISPAAQNALPPQTALLVSEEDAT